MNVTSIITIAGVVALLIVSSYFTLKSAVTKRRELKSLIRKNYVITDPKSFCFWLESKSVCELNDEIDRFRKPDQHADTIKSLCFLKKKEL